jgi:V/A-type H+/Na+-transporting ATPase subunit I
MGIRPRTARWFELLAPTGELATAVEALARSGAAQIETRRDAPPLEEIAVLRHSLDEYDRVRLRYGPYLPTDDLRASPGGAPAAVIEDALARLAAWAKCADPLIVRLEALEHERTEGALWRELLQASPESLPELDELASVGPTLAVRALAIARTAPRIELPSGVMRGRVEGTEHAFLLIVGPPADLTAAEQALAPLEPRRMEVAGAMGVESRLPELERSLAERRAELEALHRKHEIRRAIADFRRVRWFVCNVPNLPHTRNFSIVTGWSDDFTGARLERALQAGGAAALLHFPPPPEGLDPPVILINPAWVRPFQTFAALLGTPSRREADPSIVLALVAPILFGYMFGDVGHGLVLIAAGLALRRRVPTLALLVPAGISSALFGLVYGCVFSLEGLIEPLWVQPLEAPLEVLLGSLVVGAAVLTLGLALAALATAWSGSLPVSELSLVLVYAGVLGLFAGPAAGLLVLAGFVACAVGAAAEADRQRARAALRGIGELVERSLQLLVNTLSFARVGAFALAHAGLSAAVATLASVPDGWSAKLAVLIVGNAFIVLLEGLVVSIQTTRLVLFEFFARFLRGEGRVFRPLLPPVESSA